MTESFYRSCRLCPRACGVDRTAGERGVCGSADVPHVAHTMLHMWEEPCLSGTEGSGAVFFSGCGLGCVYCQNARITDGACGKAFSASALADEFLSLQKQGANNINLVTAAQYAPHVVEAVAVAKTRGLTVPVVYNSSGYESVETLRMLAGTVDIYLPDFRYYLPETAQKYSSAPDYPEKAKDAITEMVRQTGRGVYNETGKMTRGCIVRLLLLPDHLIEAKMILRWLYSSFGDTVTISLMRQYTPMPGLSAYPELCRKVTETEYFSLVDYARELGVTNAFTQEGEAASESFIPKFSYL